MVSCCNMNDNSHLIYADHTDITSEELQLLTVNYWQLHWRHTLKKLLPVTRVSHLVSETCKCVSQSATSLFWYKIPARNWAQLYSSTETVRHVTRTVQRDWPERLFWCKKLCWTCVKFFVQVSCASFWYKFLEPVLQLSSHNLSINNILWRDNTGKPAPTPSHHWPVLQSLTTTENMLGIGILYLMNDRGERSRSDSEHSAGYAHHRYTAQRRYMRLSVTARRLVPPATDTVTVGRRGFYYAGPATWNSLPPHMTDMSMSLFSFWKLSKTFLFHWHYTVNYSFW